MKLDMKNLFKKIKEAYLKARIKCFLYSVRRSYYLQLQKDLMIYGCYFEEKINYKWWQKIIRLIQRLPRDKRYVNPNDVMI
jgi:hypothetical protein